jgi:hypothetical protein
MHEIDYVLLLRLDYMFCQSFELCLGYMILYVQFWKVHLTAVIMPIFRFN